MRKKIVYIQFFLLQSFLSLHAAVIQFENRAASLSPPDSLPVSGDSTGLGKAFSFETVYIAEGASCLSGGLEQSGDYMGLWFTGLQFRTEKAGLWKGGKLFIRVLNTHGGMVSANSVGDLQAYSNIENGNYTFIYELCYEQKFGKLLLTTGVNDLAIRFTGSDNGADFINSSFGVLPSVSKNAPVSIFPKAAPGMVLTANLTEDIDVKAAIYDGDPGSLDTDPFNINWSISSDQGYLTISQADFKTFGETGTVKMGAYYHSPECYHLDDSTVTEDGNWGSYIIADQLLVPFTEAEGKGLSAFFQLGMAPANRNSVDYYAGGGLHLSGFSHKRAEDKIGLAVAYMHIGAQEIKVNPGMLSSETAIEFMYKAQITENLMIQPDVQYIIHPGAFTGIDNALVALLRVQFSFDK